MTEALWQNARLVRIAQRTPRIRSFFFELPAPFEHRPGQHVDVRLTAPDGYEAKRSYSIASAPDHGGIIELAIDRLEDGEVSTFFHDVALVGDEIDIRGPLGGHFTWEPRDSGPLLLIAGGSGLVPLMSMIRTWVTAGSDIPIALLFSVRRVSDALYLDELELLAARLQAFKLRLSITREASVSAGAFGRRIDAAMVSDVLGLLPKAPRHVFICGSNGFCSAATGATAAAGIADVLVRTERYGG